MIKSIFIGEKYLDRTINELVSVGANHYILILDSVNKKRWTLLKKTNSRLAISISAFDHGGCPLNPSAIKEMQRRIKRALTWKPDEIWLDHFRFDGHWESVGTRSEKEYLYKDRHIECKWCRGRDRSSEITKLARKILYITPKEIKIGYFAVPFVLDKYTNLVNELGQDHRLLGQVFDLSSPMLYHRMIDKPTSYISFYVKYLKKATKKPVLPIIQTKDMPDDLLDELEWKEFERAFKEASKSPSVGVSIFYWTHAVEKNKTDWIEKVFSL